MRYSVWEKEKEKNHGKGERWWWVFESSSLVSARNEAKFRKNCYDVYTRIKKRKIILELDNLKIVIKDEVEKLILPICRWLNNLLKRINKCAAHE